ncbi:MAG TPA: hypothetical protein VNF73_06685, partial [Candidatus Saccharimonadales bacterium]|nr:hypothetical protein [Candidatus Saccharimonadales bacterium]
MSELSERLEPSDRRARHIPHHIASLLLRSGVTAPSFPEVEPVTTSSGTLSVDPTRATVGEWGTWTLTFTVGDAPIEELGGIRVQLPEPWHAGIRNSAFRMQATYPREPNFVSVRCSRADVVLQTFVE